MATLQDVFDSGFDSYAVGRVLHPRELNAARSIRQCFTPALGAHLHSCPSGDYERVQFHACRHRSCPRCAQRARDAWVDGQLKRLLDCPHFHVVFTVPHSLLALWERNRAWFIGQLFASARDSLLQLLADPRHLGAVPGLLMSLHTWGRTLSYHPHVHCLLTAGGLDDEQRWRSTRAGWLLPVRPLQKLFRGKLLDALWQALKASRLQLPPWTTEHDWLQQIKGLYRKHWNIEIRPPYEHGRGVALYLARYAKGGPLPQQRPLRLTKASVEFDYTNHRSGRTATLRLPTHTFIERVLWHAPPKGVHTTRHAGLYSTPRREQHALAAAALASATPSRPWPRPAPQPAASAALAPSRAQRCPACGGPLLRTLILRPSLRRQQGANGEISLSGPPWRSTGPPSHARTGRSPPARPNPSLKLTPNG